MASSAPNLAHGSVPALPHHAGLVLAPRPFAREEEISLHGMPEGLSIAEMLTALEAQGALDPALRPWVRVTIGGEKLPRELWPYRCPEPDQTIVVEVAPMGSNAVRTILQIAVLALAAFAGPIVAGAYGAFAGAVATAAISVAGMMAVNALAPIKQPEVAAREQRYSLDAGSNAARPNEVIPVVLGRRRIMPARCANWYTVTINNVVYLRQMFQPCVSWVDHESPRIGQAALESFDGVTVRWATRPDEAIEPIWFNRVPAEDGLGVPIKLASGWVTKPAPLESDVLSIDIAFLAGLFETKDSGAPKNRSVTFEFRYGPRDGDPSAATPCPFAGPGGQLTFTRDKLVAWRQGWEWAVTRGDYDIHIRRITNEESNNAKISDELTWVCIRSFRNEPAVRDLANKPWIELELQASDQLNGVPNDFNFIATSIVPQATADGPGELIVTRNPADLFLAASYAPLSDVELDDDERDFAGIAAWRALCVEKGWNCDLAEQSEVSVGELMQRTAAAGRARPTLDYGALAVVVDWEKPTPRQMFTPRNVSSFQGEAIFPAPVHALRVRFSRLDKDYDDDTVTVFAQKPGSSEFYDLDTASIYEAIEIRDKTDIDEVEWEGARLLAERVLRPERFTFEQDLEYLTAREGARAWLAHHVALVGEISGRVSSRYVDPTDATHKGLALDEVVVMVAGRSYDLAWRPSADAPLQVFPLETLPGASDVVWFADPAPALADQPWPGDLVVVFEHAVELLDVIVDRIEPKDGLKASISCVPYAEALQHVGEGPIPAYRTSVSRPPTLPGSGQVINRNPRAIDQLLNALGEAVKSSGTSIEALKILQDLMQETLDQYTDLTDQAVADAIDLRLRIFDAIVDAGGKVLDLKKELTPPSGRPVGATLDDQVRQVDTAKETIIEHYTEMTVGFSNAAAALATESIVRATQDEALSAFQIALAAVVNDNYSTLNVTIATLTTQQNTTAMALTTLTSNFNGNVASVSSQLSTLSSTQSAQASSISILSSTVGGHTSSISSISTTLATINGQLAAAWGVDVTVDGRTIGIKGLNSGATGGWVFDGDYFFFRTPGGNKPLVSITGSLIYFGADCRFGGDLVVDGSLTFTKVANGSLTDWTNYADGTYIDITTTEQSMGGYYRYCAGGDIDVVSGFAVQNNGSTDDGTIAGIYCDGALVDNWPKQWPKSFTERDSQTTTITNPGVGYHFIELKAYAISPSASLRKILLTLPSTNRRR
jgi:hypothetical protein